MGGKGYERATRKRATRVSGNAICSNACRISSLGDQGRAGMGNAADGHRSDGDHLARGAGGLPVLRKPELMEAQAANRPSAGLPIPQASTAAASSCRPARSGNRSRRVSTLARGARVFAAGIRNGEFVHNALSYHMTPGGFILDEGVRALGARVFPAGVGNTESQVEAAAFLKPDAYAGTPDFLKVMLDKAAEMGRDLSSIRKALVSGGRAVSVDAGGIWERGVAVMQAYATADLGVIAYESAADGEPLPGMIVNEDLIVEIVRPGTDDPVPAGEVGEWWSPSFNPSYPLIRFGTGDLSAVLDEPSPCGRTNMRIKGWMGRADQRTKVKGMFVDPKQVDAVVKAVPGIARARLVVDRDGDADAMTLMVEPAAGARPTRIA
jgi:phenylacetate-CoA ligase